MTARQYAINAIEELSQKTSDGLTRESVYLIEQYIQSAILAEREACAKICDDERLALFKSRKPGDDAIVYKVRAWQISDIASAIRARSNPAPDGVFTPDPAQTMDSVEKIDPDPVSV